MRRWFAQLPWGKLGRLWRGWRRGYFRPIQFGQLHYGQLIVLPAIGRTYVIEHIVRDGSPETLRVEIDARRIK